jgi:membrane dipeptidase
MDFAVWGTSFIAKPRSASASRSETNVDGGPLREFQANGSRRQFLSTVAKTAGAAILLRARLGWAADITHPRVADIVAKTIGIDTHNHIDVPLTAAEMPGPNLALDGEIKRSGLSAICMTFATDYQPGDAYDRFLKGMASMDRQLKGNGMKRSLTPDDVRSAHKNRQPTVIQAIGVYLTGWPATLGSKIGKKG